MLVFGDRSRTVAPREALRTITATLREAETAAAGPERHDLIVRAFIEASGLVQGIIDAEFALRGEDAASPAQEVGMALLVGMARKLAASAWSGFLTAGPPVSAELMNLALTAPSEEVEVKRPEGYAFYAVYPEAYLKAAAESPWCAPPMVIGLRSIGTGLAALVAAVTGATEIVTLRPTGHPFNRELRASDGLKARLAAHAGPFAVVDEGPGLSGSSFAAAVELLKSLGVRRDRIVILPSHANGPGPQTAAVVRAAWNETTRRPATFESLIGDEPLTGWFEDLTGPIERIENLSGGLWAGDRADAPGVSAAMERLKYRITSAHGVWLAKFAGLGSIGAAKLARALTLARGGLISEPLACRRGFLVERWVDGEPGLHVERAALIEHLGRYLGLRALAFPAEPREGASLGDLAEMVRVNVSELFGDAAASRLAQPPSVATVRPVHVDGRLHRWEWLTAKDGRLIKTDALDHACGHDLVGCQDIAWDVAGARLELDLSEEETGRLCTAIQMICDRPVDRDLLAFFDVAYPAFQAGLWSLAGDQTQLARYAARLA